MMFSAINTVLSFLYTLIPSAMMLSFGARASRQVSEVAAVQEDSTDTDVADTASSSDMPATPANANGDAEPVPTPTALRDAAARQQHRAAFYSKGL